MPADNSIQRELRILTPSVYNNFPGQHHDKVNRADIHNAAKFIYDALGNVWEKFHRAPPTTEVYHYTNADSVVQILSTQELWLTQIGSLNDHSELYHSVALFKKLLGAKKRQIGAMEHPFRKELETFYEGITACFKGDEPLALHRSHIFIVSFSSSQNDLRQWIAYGGSKCGYSLGFDSQELCNAQSKHEFLFAPIEHSRRGQRKLLKLLLDEFELAVIKALSKASDAAAFPALVDLVLTALIKRATLLFCFFKHESFQTESEWRVAIDIEESTVDGRVGSQKFIHKGGLLRRHLPLRLYSNGQKPILGQNRPLLLKSVLIGPTEFKDFNRLSIKSLFESRSQHALDAKPVKVTVTASEIPYRILE